MENSHFKKLFESYDELAQVIKNKELKIKQNETKYLLYELSGLF